MCQFIERVLTHILGFCILFAMFNFCQYIPLKLYARHAQYHCVASAEDGVSIYLQTLQQRCPDHKKNIWVVPKEPFNIKTWCYHYHIVAHTNIMARMQIMEYIDMKYGPDFVYKGAIHLIEGTCNDMYNPTVKNVCTVKRDNEVAVVYNSDFCLGQLSEQVMPSDYADYARCLAGDYRDLMVKFVEAKMEQFKFGIVLNRVTFSWPLVGKDSECEILDKMFP